MNEPNNQWPNWPKPKRPKQTVDEQFLGEWSAKWGRVLDQAKAERGECAEVNCREPIDGDGLCALHRFELWAK